MSDIRKLLDIINETTVAGSVATVAAPMGEMQKRVEETATEETKNPEVIEYGMWENSALATTSKLKKNRGKSAKVVKSIYGEDVQSEAANPKQQAAIAIAKKKEVAEGKFTINAKTGAKLDPRTGAELPPKEKPLTMKKMFTQPKQPKLTLDDVWRKVEDVVGRIFPDGDPIDYLAPWLEKHGIRDFKIGEILDRAAKKNGYKDLYDYYDSMKDQYDRDNVAEAGHQSPHAKLAQLKAKYDAALKSPNPNMTTLRRIRDEIIKLEFDLGLKEGVAEDQLNELSPELLARYRKAKGDEYDHGWKWDPEKEAQRQAHNEPIAKKVSHALYKELEARRKQSGVGPDYRPLKKDEQGVAEETEQIDEVSMEKLLKYVPNAVADLSDREIRINTGKDTEKDAKKVQDRKKGLSRAAGKIGYKMAPESVAEGTLEESDLILNPASLSKLSRDLVSHDQDRTDHEVEMAKSDLYQAGKNAVRIFELIKDISEEEGLEGWVQEKIIKANDYLNTIREYLEGKELQQQEMTGGVIAGGGVG